MLLLLWVGGDEARSSHVYLPDPYRPEGYEGPRGRRYFSIDNIQSTVWRGHLGRDRACSRYLVERFPQVGRLAQAHAAEEASFEAPLRMSF